MRTVGFGVERTVVFFEAYKDKFVVIAAKGYSEHSNDVIVPRAQMGRG